MSANLAPSMTAASAPGVVPALTGIRGLAAWWVVLYHFRDYVPGLAGGARAFAAHGYLAVDLFFELSGFILALNYLPMFRDLHSQNALRFLGLRLARIYPLHAFMLLAFLLNPIGIAFFSSADAPGTRYDTGYFALSMVLLQNWGFTDDLAWNIPAWSISTEWCAYLLFPFVAWAATRMGAKPVRAILGSVAVVALLALGLTAMHETLGSNIARNGLIRCLTEFCAGLLLYQFWRTGRRSPRLANAAIVLFVVLVAAYVAFSLPDYYVFPIAFLFLIYGLAAHDTPLARLLSLRIVEQLGILSYATYMVHYFVKDWTKFLLVRPSIPGYVPSLVYFAVTFVASIALYHWIEVPGRVAGRALVRRTMPARPDLA